MPRLLKGKSGHSLFDFREPPISDVGRCTTSSYDMVGIPLTRLAERLVPAPAEKNLVAVAANSS